MSTHILIVDDNTTSLYMLETLLTGHGFEVTSAENGRDALEKARLAPPDLIVTDILMPVMDGYALCREWKSDDALKRIPLIFYTATYTDPKDEAFALSLGADRFILKPQEPEVLISILREVLQQAGTEKNPDTKPLGEEMEFFRQHNEILFKKLEKKMADLETVNRQLREDEERYRMIAENLHESVSLLDLDLNHVQQNFSRITLSGYDPEDVMAIPIQDHLTPESYRVAQQMLAEEMELEVSGKAVDPNRSRTLELELYHKDGGTIWQESTVTFQRDEEGRPVGILMTGRNTTDRKRIENQLRESEELYRTALETTSDGVSILQDGIYVYTNQRLLDTIGRPDETLIGSPGGRFMHPEDLAKVAALYERRPKGSPFPSPYDVRVIKPDGSIVHVRVFATRIRYRGKPSVLSFVMDITDRKRAEEQLRENEERYRTILESIEDGYWEVDLKGSYTFCNDALCNLTGFPREELLAKDRFRYTDPETAKKTYKIFNEIYRTGILADVHEYQFTKKDGSRAIHELSVSLRRDAEGNPIGFRGISRDVTERRAMEKALVESERRYRMIVENMHDVIMIVGLDLTEKYRSPSAARLTGHGPEELAGVPLQEQVTPESYALAEQVLGEELEKEFGPNHVDPHRSRMLELEVYHKDGGIIWVEETATFLRDRDGKAVAILLAVRDITERKRLEEEKGKLEGQLIQAQKMETVGRLAGGVAHDFNNMLSVILGYVDLAKLSLVKEHPVLKDIVEIEKAAIRSRDITAQLLAFSRKQIISPTVLNLNDLIMNTKKSLGRLIGEDIDLRVHLEEEPWMIKFDPSQIEQIMVNLVVNARDAMPDGGKLTVETKNIVADESYSRSHVGFTPGDYVQLSVSDNGTGMDRETMDHVFEPFFTTKEVGKGTGLGMATVYGIIKQNNGYINVYSEPGHGTTFTIYLPRTAQGKDVREEDEKEAFLNGVGTILLVEDDPMVLEITRGMLEAIGYGVIVAETPHDAVNLYQDHDTPISLVVTDVVMPSMSGKELVDRLNEIRPNTRALFMSGYTEDTVAHHGVLEEGVHFLQKPFRLGDLARTVREAMKFD